ncbi:hypothetical protein GCM10009634_06910 [Saccharothrix xinjiangensis]
MVIREPGRGGAESAAQRVRPRDDVPAVSDLLRMHRLVMGAHAGAAARGRAGSGGARRSRPDVDLCSGAPRERGRSSRVSWLPGRPAEWGTTWSARGAPSLVAGGC